MKKRQVLFLGNGLNRSYGGFSWDDMLEKITVRKEFKDEDINLPMPLKAILLTDNNIKEMLGNSKGDNEKDNRWYGEITNDEQMSKLQKLLSICFDDILTTNYSYEIEEASLGRNDITERHIKNMSKSTIAKVEPKYLLHSYNEVSCGESKSRVWHVHGEARKPNSMVLGHYWYGELLYRMINEMNAKGNDYSHRQKHNQDIDYNCWMDSFILGDVYILGFGFSTSESDLWWLLNRRYREKAEKGRIYYYDLNNDSEYEKIELLKLLGVEIIDFGMTINGISDKDEISRRYREFYEKALVDIENKVRNAE